MYDLVPTFITINLINLEIVMSDGAIVDGTNGASGDDTLTAADDGSKLVGGSGDDTLISGSGDDVLNGGSGFDTAVYEGSVTDYITVDTDGDGVDDALAIDDGKGNTIIFSTGGDEGTDILKQVEALQFSDYTFYLDGTNNAVLTVADAAIATEESGNNSVDVLSNDIDLDGDLLVVKEAISESGAIVTINADGTLNYDANGQFDYLNTGETATDIVTYTVTDEKGSTVTGTVTITIQGSGNENSILEGNGIDGYLVGSTVFADTNGDGVLSEDEVSDQTDGTGSFTLANPLGDLILQGGIDISTGLAFEGTLRAPEGSTSITALSTLVSSLMNSGSSQADAVAQVQENFNINSTTDILNIDPIAATLAGDAAGETMMAKASQILNTVLQIASLLDGASTEDINVIIDAVFTQMAENLSQNGNYDLTNSTVIDALIVNAASLLNITLSVELTSGASIVVADSNDQTELALAAAQEPDSIVTGEMLLTDIAQVSIVTQSEISNALESAAEAGTLDAINQVVSDYTGENLEASITAASTIVGDVDGLETVSLNTGGFVVVWQGVGAQDLSSINVYGQRYDASGVEIGDNFLVNSDYIVSSQYDPEIIALAGGGFLVSWQSTEQDGSNFDVYAQRYDSNGVELGDNFLINTDFTVDAQYAPAITALTDGGFLVTWEGTGAQDTAATGIYAQRYDASGAEVGGNFLVNTDDIAGYQLESSTTALTDGGFLVTWHSSGIDYNYDIYGQRYDSNGLEVGNNFIVNTDVVAGNQFSPSTSALADGGFLVTWQSDNQDGSGWGIYGQRYDFNGQELGDNFLVNSDYTTHHQLGSATTSLADGGFLVTWQSYEQDGIGSDYGIYAQRYDANGLEFGDSFLVNTDFTAGDQVLSATTALADGGYLISWSGNGAQDTYGIYAQRYDINGVELGGNFLVNTDYTSATQTNSAVAGLVSSEYGLNYNPIAAQDFANTNEDSNALTITFAELMANDLELDEGDTISITAFDDSGLLAGVTLSADFTAQTVTVTYGDAYQSLAEGETATLSFGYTLSDDNGGSTNSTVNVTVTGTNDAPVAEHGTIQGFEDAGFVGNIFAGETPISVVSDAEGHTYQIYSVNGSTDIVGQTLTRSIGTNDFYITVDANGDVVIDTNGAFNTLSAGLNGQLGFSYQLIDEQGGISESQSVTIFIQGENDIAIVGTDSGATGEDDGAITFTFAELLANDYDVDSNDSISITAFDGTSLLAGVTLSTDWSAQTVTVIYGDAYQSLGNGETDQLSFSYTLTEDQYGADGITDQTGTVNVTITGTNDAPEIQVVNVIGVITDDAVPLTNDASGSLSFTDVDLSDRPTADESVKSIEVIAQDGVTQVILSAAQLSIIETAFYITPDAGNANNGLINWDYSIDQVNIDFLSEGQTVTAIFTVTVTDDEGASAEQDVTITINGTNDAPILENGLVATGGEFQVNSHTTQEQIGSSVTSLADGGYVVTWESYLQDGDWYSVHGQRFDSTGTEVGAEFQVNTYTTDSQSQSSVVSLDNGGFVVVWTSAGQDGDSNGIYGQRYDAAGNVDGTEFQINTEITNNQFDPSAASLADGGFVVTWTSLYQDAAINTYGVFGQRYDGSGAVVGSEFQVNTYTPSNQDSSDVTSLADGGFVVTWSSGGQDGDITGVFGQRYDATGSEVGSEFQINTYTLSYQNQPSIADLADGGFVVTWSSYGQDGDVFGVYGQRYDVAGDVVGAEFQINSYTTSQQSNSSVAGLDDGGFVVTWDSFNQDGHHYGVYGQRYAADGSEVGSEFLINSTTASGQSQPSIASLADGGFIVSWSSYGQDGGTYGIYAQQFSFTTVVAQEDGSTVDMDLSVLGSDVDSDDDGSSLIYSIANTLSEGSASISGTILTFDPSADFQDLALGETREVIVQVQAMDSHGAISNTLNVNFTVTGTNDAPVANRDMVSMTEDDISLAGNLFVENWYGAPTHFYPDADAEGDTFSVYSVNGSTENVGSLIGLSGGQTVTVNENGDFVVTSDPANFQYLWDGAGTGNSFTYQLIDAHGGISEAATVNIVIEGINDTAIVGTDSGVAGEDDGSIIFTFAELLANDYDVDSNDSISITAFDGAGLPAGVTLVADFNAQTVTVAYGDAYQSLGEGEQAALSFNYTLTETQHGSAPDGITDHTGTVNITVTGSDEAIVTLSNGYVVTWTSVNQDGSGNGVYGQRYDTDGQAVGNEFRVSSENNSNQDDSSVTGLSNGGFIVTWTSYAQDGSGAGIFGQSFDVDGVAQGVEFQINTEVASWQYDSSVTAVSDGGFVVTWTSNDQDEVGSTGVYGQVYDAVGQVVGSEFSVNTEVSGNQHYSTVAALDNSGFVVTWTSVGQDGSAEGIYGQVYNASGQPQGAEFIINTETGNAQVLSSTIGLANGGFVVTWSSALQDGSTYGVYGQRFDDSGLAVGNEFQVNTETYANQHYSDVAATSDGGFVVTWSSEVQDGSSFGVYGQRFDSDGLQLDSEFQINSETINSQSESSITILSDDSFIVTWESEGQDGSGLGIYGQLFDANGNASGGEYLVNSYSDEDQKESSVSALNDAKIIGTESNDTIYGTDDNDHILGLGGNDTLIGKLGDDVLEGGSGDDSLHISDDGLGDHLDGGTGSDRITVDGRSASQDYVLTADANGVLVASLGSITLDFSSIENVEQFWAGSGNDSLDVSGLIDQENVSLNGGYGVDSLIGGGGDDTFYLADLSSGDHLDGGSGVDTAVLQDPTTNLDIVFNTDSNGDLVGRIGGEALDITSIEALQTFSGGAGNDSVDVSGLSGQQNTYLFGNNGNDSLTGGNGNDTIFGGSGNDYLVGGLGNDSLRGDAGADTFVFRSGDIGTDTIADFNTVQGDMLDLTDLLSGVSAPDEDGINLDDYINFSVSGSDAVLEVDVQGDGSVIEQTIILSGQSALVSGLSDVQIIDNLLADGNLDLIT